jgi:hypothetical protein
MLASIRLCSTLLVMAAAVPLQCLAIEWPQEIDATEGKIVVYQPQPEKLTGNILSGRAAMSLELKNKAEPIFGAFWFTAKIDTDQDAGTALVRDVKVTRVRWPDSTAENQARFTQVVEQAMPQAGFEISLERLSASLATAEREQKSLANLKNDPPKIVFSEELAVLLIYDGEPRFEAIENSNYERALNTPFAVARDKKSKRVYLSSGSLWYEASDPKGPFKHTASPPADLVKMLPKPEDETAPKTPPKIVVATAPTELVSTDGKPNWKSLSGGKLLYVANTETAWLRDTSDQQMYLLLSGRWFKSSSQSGPWAFVRADQLPAAFKEIPPGSDIGGLRASVAGTQEAEEAVLDAQIPQTAAIKRSEAKLEIQYDGAPKFEKIPGTNVAHAVNTGAQVLEINKRYYAVDNGVWFTAAAATGPWAVADKVPQEEIDKIPPSSPVYNTIYVHIYESTPEVVYVGYLPGYMWSFPYYGVPVYGTGWYYPPYWGGFYYPRPPTWGLHVGYNPWTGWNFGVSWSNGFFSVGASWSQGWRGPYRPWGCCGGWYGGGYHRGPTIINTGDINIGNSVSIGNRTNIGNKIGNTTNINRNRLTQNNLYQRAENKNRVADRSTATRNLKQARAAQGRDNDVFADKSGTVARRAGDQWQVRDQGKWQDSAAAAARDAAPQARERASEVRQSHPNVDRADLNRAHQARQHGVARERGAQGAIRQRRR